MHPSSSITTGPLAEKDRQKLSRFTIVDFICGMFGIRTSWANLLASKLHLRCAGI
ncbi:MAG: hypothetical protein JRJ23_07540 [Deltaproteobacteria bacterium]|nr:hypothetical protein [Deltaproteobacteria bacterium]